MQRALSESINICLLALTCFICIALVSYSSRDPGWTLVGNDDLVRNLLGVTGAWFASGIYLLFGLGAWLLPLTLVLLTSRRMFGWPGSLPSMEEQTRFRGLPQLGACLLVLTVAGLADLHFYELSEALPLGGGGRLGSGLSGLLLPWFGFLGATLILLTLLLVGFTLSFNMDWGRIADLVGTGLLAVVSYLRTAGIGWFSHIRKKLAFRPDTRPALQPVVINASAMDFVPPEPGKHLQPGAGQAEPETAVKNPRQRLPAGRQTRASRKTSGNAMPSVQLLVRPDKSRTQGYSAEELEDMSRLLEKKLKDYRIDAKVTSVSPGPVITRFEVLPAAGVKVSRISALVKDLARSLAVISVRIVEVIPGKPVVGVEIPNADRSMVRLSEVLTSSVWNQADSPLSLALGNDISGQPVVVDLSKMPHLLVAGTTGAGKSVGLNAMILSFLYKARPDQVRLIMVDPKMLELSVYDGIPHLLTPVVTDMKDAANALRWCVEQMEHRYKLMASLGVRNITGFNQKLQEAGEPLTDPLWVSAEPADQQESPPELKPLPYIVVIVDEFADMMMIVGKKVEELISRIAQKARAAGIHLILATQRPSVDVITGLIKANVPTRIAYQVSSKIDSRTILDQAGAEQLLGHGDLLYLPAGSPLPVRVHGAFVSDEEVHAIVAAVKSTGEPNYEEEILTEHVPASTGASGRAGSDGESSELDECYDRAVAFVIETGKASISSVQRKFRIGYNRAARLIEAMEEAGVISPMNSNGSRTLLVPKKGQD